MRSARLNLEELQQLKWLLGQVLTLIALWTLSFLDNRGTLLVVVAGAAVLATLIFPRLPGWIPSLFWKALAPVLVVLVLADFFLSGADVLPPLIRLITILSLVRCLAYRTRREDLQLLLLTLFMAVISGVLTLSMVFALQILLYAPTAMILLFMVNLLESNEDKPLTREDWAHFRWWPFLVRVRSVLDLRLTGFAAGLFGVVVAVSSLIFILMPRFQFDHAIPFFQLRTSSLTGFSDSVDLGGVTDIVQDNRVALRIDPPSREAIPDNPYFRMLVLDYYSNGQFSLSRSVRQDPSVLVPFENAWLSGGLGMRVHEEDPSMVVPTPRGAWTFYLEGGISKYLPLLGPFQTLRFQNRQEGQVNWGFLVVSLDSAKNGVFSYQAYRMAEAGVLAASRKDQTLLPGAAPLVAARNDPVWADLEYPMTQLAVPIRDEDAAYLRQVVQHITGGEQLSALEFSRRTIEYLGEHHRYSLRSNVEARGRDRVVAWLQEQSPGHCEYFAGAFTILARTAGFPTRIVIGFNGGSWNTVEDYFVVRNRHAHAWNEIFDGEGRWIRVDPTPGAQRFFEEGLGGDGRRISEESGWSAWVDSLRILWYRSIVNFDDRSQLRMATELRDWLQTSAREWRGRLEGAWDDLQMWWDQPMSWGRALILGAAALVLVALYIVYLQWHRLRAPLLRTRLGRKLLGRRDPIRGKAGRLLYRYEKAMHLLPDSVKDAPDRATFETSRLELQSIRYGDLRNAGEAGRIFRDARQRMRQSRKLQRRDKARR